MSQNTQAFRPNCHESFNKYLSSSAGKGEIFYLMSPSKGLQATRANDEKPESGTRQTWLQNSLPPNICVSLASHGASRSVGSWSVTWQNRASRQRLLGGKLHSSYLTFPWGWNPRGATLWPLAPRLPLPPHRGRMSHWMWGLWTMLLSGWS